MCNDVRQSESVAQLNEKNLMPFSCLKVEFEVGFSPNQKINEILHSWFFPNKADFPRNNSFPMYSVNFFLFAWYWQVRKQSRLLLTLWSFWRCGWSLSPSSGPIMGWADRGAPFVSGHSHLKSWSRFFFDCERNNDYFWETHLFKGIFGFSKYHFVRWAR